jgi:hypothetical protein
MVTAAGGAALGAGGACREPATQSGCGEHDANDRSRYARHYGP